MCSTCQAETRKRTTRARFLEQEWGLTIEEYEKLLDLQGGVCAICGGGRRYNLDIDHDHDEERALLKLGYEHRLARRYSIRGLLCKRCNRRLLPASMNSDEILFRAAAYVKRPWLVQKTLAPRVDSSPPAVETVTANPALDGAPTEEGI